MGLQNKGSRDRLGCMISLQRMYHHQAPVQMFAMVRVGPLARTSGWVGMDTGMFSHSLNRDGTEK
jgi:hypothetical protein